MQSSNQQFLFGQSQQQFNCHQQNNTQTSRPSKKRSLRQAREEWGEDSVDEARLQVKKMRIDDRNDLWRFSDLSNRQSDNQGKPVENYINGPPQAEANSQMACMMEEDSTQTHSPILSPRHPQVQMLRDIETPANSQYREINSYLSQVYCSSKVARERLRVEQELIIQAQREEQMRQVEIEERLVRANYEEINRMLQRIQFN